MSNLETNDLSGKMKCHCPYCLNLAMFFSWPGEIPVSEAGCQMKYKTTVVHVKMRVYHAVQYPTTG